MAKGQRSNRQKALRSVRRKTITATWVAEADAKRTEALAKCMAAAPVPVDNTRTEELIAHDVAVAAAREAERQEVQRRRLEKAARKAAQGGASSMAVDGQEGRGRRRAGGVRKFAMKKKVRQISNLDKARAHELHTKRGRKLAKKKRAAAGAVAQ